MAQFESNNQSGVLSAKNYSDEWLKAMIECCDEVRTAFSITRYRDLQYVLLFIKG
jgi:hypothetical protein